VTEFVFFMPLLLASMTLTSTGLGGIAAFRLHHRLHLLLGFSSGAVIGVALFDMLPAVFAMHGGASHMPISAFGFLVFFGLERFSSMRRGNRGARNTTSDEQELGVLSAAGLCVHSFLDGIAIGVGFQTSSALGFLIAMGIIAHDLSDGLNTVTVVLAHENPRRRALFWLIIDMLAPVVGAATTLFVNFDGLLPWVLAFFFGSFLYIGASDLLPEAKLHDSPLVGLATVSGMLAIFVTTHVLR
jgi:zinc transporter ZupT